MEKKENTELIDLLLESSGEADESQFFMEDEEDIRSKESESESENDESGMNTKAHSNSTRCRPKKHAKTDC